jgi:hypothetical protein
MKTPQPPRLETRRRREFSAELQERARAWIPHWEVSGNEGDLGLALLEIAARFNSEVAERLDIAGEKMRRGFLDWLAVRREAARPSRMPVVFKLTDAARDPVLASAPVRMQADANGTAVVFETEKDVRVIPGLLDTVIGADADADAFYLPPPGLSDLKPLKRLPSQWQAKSFASAGAEKIQLDPELGLVAGMLIRAGRQEYRIVAVDKDLVQIDPPLAADLPESSLVSKVTTFSPFGGEARNWQEHVLYLGDAELLNIEAPATIEVVGAFERHEEFTWEYWGKRDPNDAVAWQSLEFDRERQKDVTDAVVLSKPKGAVEEKKIGGKNSRWIRAYAKNVSADPLTSDELSIRVNVAGCEDDLPCSFEDDTPTPLAEAMANTTPLVLDNVFFPLGKEPRQFDAFYLGSQEAFSKPGAKVQLCFQMADPTFSALTAVREGALANQVLVGVARDRALHLLSFDASGRIGKFRDREPLQPPGITPLALDPQPPWPLPVWPDEPDFFMLQGFSVATSARNSIWVWHEHSLISTASRWIDFGKLPADVPVSDAPVDGLLFLNGTPPVLIALREGQLFVRSWPNGAQWDPVITHVGADRVRLKSIVPVLVRDAFGRLLTSTTAGMLGIDEQNKLFTVALDGTCTSALSTFTFDPAIRPVAVEVGGVRTIAAVTKPANESDPPDLVANDSTSTKQVTLAAGSKVLVALDAIVVGGSTVQLLATVRENSAGRLVTWAPFETGPAASLFKSPIATGGLLEGAPTKVNNLVVIPGSSADLFVISFDPSQRLLKTDDIDIGVVLPAAVATLAVNDLMVRIVAGEPVKRKITAPVRTRDAEDFYPIISDFPESATGLFAYKRADEMSGAFSDPDLTLDDTDHDTAEGDWLLIDGEFYQVDSITISGGDRVATLVVPNSNGETPASGNYVRPIDTRGRVAPFMRLDTSAGGSGDWDADLLRRVPLLFPGLTPKSQPAKAFSVSVSNKPIVVVLGQEFEGLVANPVDFMVDAAFGEWRRNASDTSANPELSWEYWNGKGWWKLDITRDETQNLKATGALRFVVPVDMASSDWAGRTNFWIRGRLVGGDYGKEIVTVKIKQLSTTESEQTVNRSLEGISPPSVLKLHISYAICGDGVPPKFVLTQDSGTIRDQSDANRTPGAIVEAFVPLALTLGKLSQSLAPPAREECPPDCGCAEQPTATVQTEASATTGAGPAVSRATGRSLFIGLAATPSEEPINILLLVDERNHTTFAPMRVEALIANSFQPIVVDDTTRALGESGLLSMSFPISPTASELFGKTLTWLRLLPKESATDQWIPTLRGAYLNAAWAGATETLTRELLGSSDGAPNLMVRLARPPVLRNTLELRIREPLGEEEREALVRNDPQKVVNLRDLPGDWVLWTQVVDPNDEPPDARVYALDEASGEIRFGDGTHGRIPPIGRDSIVAFNYSRTETGQSGDIVPGNTIGPRTTLNLVSPVETVETVTSADQAAGGAPAEPDSRVLRFGFARVRHRNRAVTPRDLEDLALQSSPDFVQARAVVRRGYVKLVIVMRGDNPQPTAAQVRELRRLLLDAAPASLSAPGALRIEGPKIRRLQIELGLRVETLDHAGELGESVKSRLKQLFDTAVGGVDRDGWPLGLNPTEDDIAFALIDAPHLESITAVQRREIDEGTVSAWPETVKETEIVMLADDPVRIEFETTEVLV